MIEKLGRGIKRVISQGKAVATRVISSGKAIVAVTCGAITGLAVKAAHAAVDLSTFTVDVTGPETLAGIVLIGLSAMWAIRKIVKTINRS